MKYLRLLASAWVMMPVFMAYIGLALVPASHWQDKGTMIVLDPQTNQPIQLLWTGRTVKNFTGSYTVVVRNLNQDRIVCEAAGGPFEYTTTSSIPDPLTMDWWAPSDPRCSALPIDAYTVATCWTVKAPFWGIVPDKTHCIISNPFQIKE